MRAGFRRALVVVLICLFASVLCRPAKAQVSSRDAIADEVKEDITAAVIVIAVVIGATLYFVLRQPRFTGCVVQTADGLELTSEGGSQTYLLSGDTTGFKVGERIKITGKKQKKNASGPRPLLVTSLKKDYGVCKVPPLNPSPSS